MTDVKNGTTQNSGRIPGWVAGALVAGAFGALAWLERRRALRVTVNDTPRRAAQNLALAGLTAAVSELAMAPAVQPLARRAVARRTGLVQRLPLAEPVRDVVAIVLLDYTLYWWHVIEHKIPWLYRFHQVHHADLDLDTTTALRWHFGEFLASIPWRMAQVRLIGASPGALAGWQRLSMLSISFHHSNLCLPIAVERRLSRLIVTPRLHGIHHSIVREEQDSNWSSGLTLWDRLHGTYKANVPQDEITIGLPALREPADVTVPKSLALPLEPPLPWRLPDGAIPEHPPAAAPRERLLP